MALPKIDTPVYTIELPLSKKKIKFRPFVVKEQKNLLMAMESNDRTQIEETIKQVLHACILNEDIDVYRLPILDVEFFFINLRARSVGEIVENKYKCNNFVADKECGNLMETSVNLLDIKVQSKGELQDTFKITDKISVKMKYPEYSIIRRAISMDDTTTLGLDMVAESIEYLHDGEQFYYAHECSPGELVEFVESLSTEQFSKLETFFENIPRLKKDINLTCNKCGFVHDIEVEGLENFFD